MPTRVICPACGKPNRIEGEPRGATVICLACGARFVVEGDAQDAAADRADTGDAGWSNEAVPSGDDV